MYEFLEGLDHELTVGGVDAFFWSAARPGELSRFKCELPRAWENTSARDPHIMQRRKVKKDGPATAFSTSVLDLWIARGTTRRQVSESPIKREDTPRHPGPQHDHR